MCDKYDLNHSGTKALNIEGINFLEPFVSFHLWLEVSLIVSRSETETSLVICRQLHTCANCTLCHFSFLCSLIKSKVDKSSALDWMTSPEKSAGAAERPPLPRTWLPVGPQTASSASCAEVSCWSQLVSSLLSFASSIKRAFGRM